MGKLHEKIFHKRKWPKKIKKKKNSFDLTSTHRNANTQGEVQTHLPE